MKTSRILGFVLVFALSLFAAPYPAAFGAEADAADIAPPDDGALPVSTQEELRALDGQEGNYYLTRDIELRGEWVPIEFHGSLDGQGHAVRGLLINNLTEGLNRYGLFSCIDSNHSYGANYSRRFTSRETMEQQRLSVRNLRLEGLEIALNLPDSGEYQIGGLCGYAGDVTFENCSVSGGLRISCAGSSSSRAAGLCGDCASAGYVRFFDCQNKCEVTGNGVETVCGVCAGTPEVMTNCRNTGTVTAEQSRAAAGIVNGANLLFDCENTASVSASWRSEEMVTVGTQSISVGGVEANGLSGNSSFLTSCRNTGDVAAVMEHAARSCAVYAGGIAAVLNGNGAGMRLCENSGAVSASTRTQGVMYACETTAGGLVGKANIDTFHQSGYSQTYTDCRNNGAVNAWAVSSRPDSRAGGICGDVFVNGGHTVMFENCLSVGHVKASDMGSYGQSRVWGEWLENEYAYGGGIIGHCVSSLVDDDWDVAVRNCAAVCPDVESVLDPDADGESIASWIAPYGLREGNAAVLREDPDAKYEDDETLTVLTEEEFGFLDTYERMGWNTETVWYGVAEDGYPALFIGRAPGTVSMMPVTGSWANNINMSVELSNTTGREVQGLLLAAAYDENGRLLGIADNSDQTWVDLPFDPRESFGCSLAIYMGEDNEKTAEVRVFFLSSDYTPISNAVSIPKPVEPDA